MVMVHQIQKHIEVEVIVMHNTTVSQKAIIEYLKELDYEIILSIIEEDIAMRGKVVTDGVTFDTIVNIPKLVPPTYPSFYLVDSGLQLREAHIERPNEVFIDGSNETNIICRTCIRDERDKVYSSSASDLFHHLYKDFEGLCSKIARKEFDSKNELFSEFDSYWPNILKSYFDFSMELSDGLIDQITLNLKQENQMNIITDNMEYIHQYAKDHKLNVTVSKAMYFDIGNKMPFPLPYTYGDIYKLLQECDKTDMYKRLKKLSTSAVLYLGFNLPSGEKHFVSVYLKQVKKAKVKKKKEMSPSIILELEDYVDEPFTGGHIKAFKHEYLLKRGGSQKNIDLLSKEKKVAIVGCGSVGSALAFKLCKSGIKNLILVDPEKLEITNIGRHQLGISYVGYAKAEALKDYLQKQFIDLDIQVYNDIVQNDKGLDLIRISDLVITAIGSDAPSVEPWLSSLAAKGDIPETVSCWLEADGIAGHALRTKKDDFISFDNVCEQMSILDQEHASELLESEVGCNSTYMPYGFIDADTHINKMAHYIISILLGCDLKAISSIGDITEYKQHLKKDVNSWSQIEHV